MVGQAWSPVIADPAGGLQIAVRQACVASDDVPQVEGACDPVVCRLRVPPIPCPFRRLPAVMSNTNPQPAGKQRQGRLHRGIVRMRPESSWREIKQVLDEVDYIVGRLDEGAATAIVGAIFLNIIVSSCRRDDYEAMDDRIDDLADRLKEACRRTTGVTWIQ